MCPVLVNRKNLCNFTFFVSRGLLPRRPLINRVFATSIEDFFNLRLDLFLQRFVDSGLVRLSVRRVGMFFFQRNLVPLTDVLLLTVGRAAPA